MLEFGRRVENLAALMADAQYSEEEEEEDDHDYGHDADEVVAMSKTLNAKMMNALIADEEAGHTAGAGAGTGARTGAGAGVGSQAEAGIRFGVETGEDGEDEEGLVVLDEELVGIHNSTLGSSSRFGASQVRIEDHDLV